MKFLTLLKRTFNTKKHVVNDQIVNDPIVDGPIVNNLIVDDQIGLYERHVRTFDGARHVVNAGLVTRMVR